MNSIRVKLMVALFLVLSGFIATIWSLRRDLENNARQAQLNEETGKRALILNILEQNGKRMSLFTVTHSGVHTPDDVFSTGEDAVSFWQDNGYRGDYAADVMWLLDGEFICRNFNTSPECQGLSSNVPGPDVWINVLGRGAVRHAFFWNDGKLIESRIGSVRKARGSDGSSVSNGYFVTARVWDERFLKDIGRFVQGLAFIARPDQTAQLPQVCPQCAKEKEYRSNACSFMDISLPGPDGKDIAILRFVFHSSYWSDLNTAGAAALWLTLLLFLCLLAAFILILNLVITRPLQAVRRALESGTPAPVEKYRGRKDEVGKIVQLISRYFKQERELRTEIARRENVERTLKRAVRTLRTRSRINMTLVGAFDEKTLCQDICDVTRQEGGYLLVWMGRVEEVSGDLFIYGRSGDVPDHMTTERICLQNEPFKSGLLVKTVQTCTMHVCRSISRDAQCEWLKTEAEKHGFRSCLFLPFCKDGKTIAVMGIYSPEDGVFDPEESALLLEMAENITHGILMLRTQIANRKVEEKARQLSDELQKARKYEELGRFAADMAAEFTNQLSAISGNLDALMGSSRIDDAARKRLMQSRDVCMDAAAMAKQLMALGKVQLSAAPPLYPDEEMMRLADVLSVAAGPDIQLRTTLAESLNAIKGETDPFRAMMVGIISAMARMMGGQGQVDLRLENVEVEAEFAHMHPGLMEGEHLLLTLNGTFRRTAIDTSVEGPVSVDRNNIAVLARPFSGYVLTTGMPGVSCTVSVFLPAAINAPVRRAGNKKHAGLRAHPGETVLVVEDGNAVRVLTTTILASVGYNVLEAGDGFVALEMAAGYHGVINAVVSDVLMDKMNGVELARRIQEVRHDIKIVLMSGHSKEDLREVGVVVGNKYPFVEKPFTASHLLEVLRNLLDS